MLKNFIANYSTLISCFNFLCAFYLFQDLSKPDKDVRFPNKFTFKHLDRKNFVCK